VKIVVTGGAGFIGSGFVRYVLQHRSDVRVVNFDLLTYAGNLQNLQEVRSHPRYSFVRGDIADAAAVQSLFDGDAVDAIVNFAAETHVDRSIDDSLPFIRTNVLGTQCLLEQARKRGVQRFVQISTDEVYGSLGSSGAFREDSPIEPSSPYAASKAAADLLALSFFKTYGLPVVITRCSNNYGPYQFPEKLIPLMIMNALQDKPLPVYGDGKNVREWIYTDEHSRAVLTALEKGTPGEVYNVGSGYEMPNIEVVQEILRLLGKPESLIRYVKDRPGHDRRYAIDCSKIERQWNWSAQISFSEGLRQTIDWYRTHEDWINDIRDASYLSYFDRMYTRRDQTLAWSRDE
jgi:dTDP-glucose 4,6-dehydratase